VIQLSDFLRTTVEEILRDLSNIGSPEATIKSLQIELEKLQWRHNQEMAEMKHNTGLLVNYLLKACYFYFYQEPL
jgi:hypothetical protein